LPADAKLLEDLVAANRVLAMEGVVDGYGLVSVRNVGGCIHARMALASFWIRLTIGWSARKGA